MLFNAKAILREEQWWYYLTHSWEDKGVHTFPKGICPKVNVIVRLEYELAYYDSAVHRFKPLHHEDNPLFARRFQDQCKFFYNDRCIYHFNIVGLFRFYNNNYTLHSA